MENSPGVVIANIFSSLIDIKAVFSSITVFILDRWTEENVSELLRRIKSILQHNAYICIKETVFNGYIVFLITLFVNNTEILCFPSSLIFSFKH